MYLKYFCLLYPGGLGSSTILGDLNHKNYTEKLISFLDPVLLSSQRSWFVRCWHAKTDGSAASIFHNNCDGKGPTVTIIKSGSYIFGAYTDVSWRSSKYLLDSFLAIRPGVGTPRTIGWGCVTRFSKPWPYLRAKSANFTASFMTWPKIRYPIYDLTVKSIPCFRPAFLSLIISSLV